MFYILNTYNNKIFTIDKNKEVLDNIVKTKQDDSLVVKSTKKEIIFFDGEYRFVEDIDINKYKEQCINELIQFNKKKINETYSDHIQFDILAGIGNYGTLNEMKAFINKYLNAYNTVKNNINKISNIKELKKYDYINNYLELLK